VFLVESTLRWLYESSPPWRSNDSLLTSKSRSSRYPRFSFRRSVDCRSSAYLVTPDNKSFHLAGFNEVNENKLVHPQLYSSSSCGNGIKTINNVSDKQNTKGHRTTHKSKSWSRRSEVRNSEFGIETIMRVPLPTNRNAALLLDSDLCSKHKNKSPFSP
jgi:hypothetical protein